MMRNRPTFATCFTAVLLSYPGSSVALADSTDEFLRLLNSTQSYQSGQGIRPTDDGNNEEPGEPVTQTAEQYYVSDLDPVVQLRCVGCHQSGGTASNSGARLIFSNSAESNHIALSDFVTDGVRDSDWVLSKITGGSGHGGGTVISSGSNDYETFERYFALLSGDASAGSGSQSDFWDGLFMEPREVTLRRASLLLAARVASDESIERAKDSDEALRGEIIKLMRGEGFHDFLVSGADDRLLTDGLMNGVAFDIQTEDRFPAHTAYINALPPDNYKPEEFADYHAKTYFTRIQGDQALRWAIHREPLELIAHVVETNQSYKTILTADYTMVNPISNIAYRSGLQFDQAFVDENGFMEKDKLNVFKPARNRGHIPWTPPFDFNYDTREFIDWPDYHDWPHAGVLSTMAWMSRYPSTDTNRNRARARWTYYHFLGIDIEKSAPRTTDPVALADTDNPTLKNPACTVCHERLDPMAGAYQLFGDAGNYLDKTFGLDSLAESYTHPERFGEEPNSTGYQEGDTWYRDMRAPGFEGKLAPNDEDSLQWLALQIVEDPRFATATVKFWWPAIFGTEVLIAPEDPEGPDYDQRLRAYNAQESLVSQLARKFADVDFRLKPLLAEMLISPWYRTEGLTDPNQAESRFVELENIGSGRLLTPEELDRKNLAVFGRRWGQGRNGPVDPNHYGTFGKLGDEGETLKIFYGGTDSAGLIVRNRKKTPLMSSVSETMAIEFACLATASNLFMQSDERKIFTNVSPHLGIGDVAEISAVLSGTVEDRSDWISQNPIKFSANLVGGAFKFSLSTEHSEYPWFSTDGEGTRADLLIKEVVFRKGGEIVYRLLGQDMPSEESFKAARGCCDDGLWAIMTGGEHQGLRTEGESWVSFEADLPEGRYDVELHLATSVVSNNVNESIGFRAHITALENQEKAPATQAIKDELHGILLRAYNRPPSEQTVDRLATELDKYATEIVSEEGNRWITQGSPPDQPCATYLLWDHDYARLADPRGMIRAWNAMIHAIISSFSYLHD